MTNYNKVIDSNDIYSLVKINMQKEQLDFIITKIFNIHKNYRKEVSILFNQRFMKHIGKEVYSKYPNRIKLLENTLISLESKDKEIKEKNNLIHNYHIIFKTIIIVNALYFIFINLF